MWRRQLLYLIQNAAEENEECAYLTSQTFVTSGHVRLESLCVMHALLMTTFLVSLV